MLPIVFVDPDEAFLENARLLCEANGAPVYCYANPLEYVKKDVFVQTHIGVISLEQSSCSGLDILRSAVSNSCAISVFAVVASVNLKQIVEAMRLGAADILQKPISVSPIIDAAKHGGVNRSRGEPSREDLAIDRLTRRERQVMEQLRKGGATHEIANRLHVSIRTIESHKSKLYAKLGVRNQTELLHLIKS